MYSAKTTMKMDAYQVAAVNGVGAGETVGVAIDGKAGGDVKAWRRQEDWLKTLGEVCRGEPGEEEFLTGRFQGTLSRQSCQRRRRRLRCK